jgi:hypothetical protein
LYNNNKKYAQQKENNYSASDYQRIGWGKLNRLQKMNEHVEQKFSELGSSDSDGKSSI